MYLDFFGFSETPFSLSPNPRFIYFSKPHKEVFALLLYGIERRYGFIEMTGEVGTGKTTVLRTLLGQLDEEKYRTALIFNPLMTAVDLLSAINREYGLKGASDNCSELLDELNGFLLEENSAGRTVVLIIDEAQNLSTDLLEQIRLISNLETDTEKLIQIVLAGQPELGRMLERPELRQLNQRIALRYHIRPLDREDTWGYIEHRLKLAGGGDRVSFSTWALRWLYHYSRGTPRVINILCDRALLVAYTWDRRKVTARTVAMAFRDVMLKPALGCLPKVGRSGRLAMMAAAMVVLGYLYLSHGRRSEKPEPLYLPDIPEVKAPAPKGSGNVVATPKVTSPPPQDGVGPEIGRDGGVTPVKAPETVTKAPPPVAGEDVRNPQKPVEPAQPEEIPTPSRAETALQSFNGIAARMRVPPVGRLNGKGSVLVQLQKEAGRRGLELDAFNGGVDELLRSRQPAILEISQKGEKESRFVGITGFSRGKVSIYPSVSGKSTLKRSELASIWSGKAYILWRNSEKIRVPLVAGESGSDVIRLQILLQAAGADALEVNGVYDEATREAVKEFQRSRGIRVTGNIGAITLIQLHRAVTGPQSSASAEGTGGGGR